MARNWSGRRVATAVGVGVLVAALAGCGSDDESAQAPAGGSTSTPAPAASAVPFDADAAVPAGYTVVKATGMPLGPDEEILQVVVSKNAKAVKDGTQNVQVFRLSGGSWTEVFDAADASVPYEMQGDFGSPEADESADPVLDQKHPIGKTTAELVRFAEDHPALVVFAEDRFNPHVLGVLAVVDFLGDKANLDHYEMAQDLNAPTVVGEPDAQQLEVPNYWYPWLNGGDPAEYTQSVGMTDSEGVAVLSDSRAFLGAWVGVSTNPGVTVSQVIEGTPAADVLEPGDRILSVNGNNPEQGLGPDLLELAPGDEIDLKLDRDGAITDVTLKLADMSKAPTFWDTPKASFLGIEVAPLSGRKGLAVTAVEAGSPAATAGLKKSDAIVRIGEFSMADSGDLDAALSGRAGQDLEFEVQGSDGQSRTVVITPRKPAKGEEDNAQVALL